MSFKVRADSLLGRVVIASQPAHYRVMRSEYEHLLNLPSAFSITWDYNFVRLWCAACPDGDMPVDSFPGNPTDMAEIFEAMKTHAATHKEQR